jgi:general secretion pathway protein A
VVLIVDEAQNLDRRSMESLRLLSNLETRKHKLVQIILSGQPELDSKLSQPELRQLAQRISIKRYITPLTEEETYGYIRHRLEIVGHKGPSLFSREARQLIWKYSGGVPRKINVVCDNAFLIGYGLRKKKIKAQVVVEAIKDLSWSPFSGVIENQGVPPIENPAHPAKIKPSYSRLGLAVSLVLAVCLILAVGLNLQRPRVKLKEGSALSDPHSKVVKATSEPKGSDQSQARAGEDNNAQKMVPAETTSLDVSREKVKPDTRALDDEIHDLKKLAGLPVETNKETPRLSHAKDPGEIDEPLTKQAKYVMAERGEYLSLIIKRTYGRFDKELLSNVLDENPEINNADVISVGHVIKLPLFN